MNKKFFVIDGHALVYRSYFAFIKNPRMISSGLNTSAIYGFTNTIFRILNIQRPEFLTVVFDTKEPTWRHKNFTDYKATRPKQPDVITLSFPYIKTILKAMNIKFYEKEGFEADDLAGTITKAVVKDIDIFLFTQDKDYSQLVKENVFLFKQFKDKKYHNLGIAEVLKEYNISTPDQIRDLLALQGDTADNIPGIPDIGEKTAKKLIQEYGCIENILQNINNLTGKIKNNIEKYKDQLLLSKKLVTITTDVDFGFNIGDCKVVDFNNAELLNIFKQLEFDSFIKKLKLENNTGQLNLF